MTELKPCPWHGPIAEIEHSYHEDDNRAPRDFWHVRVSCPHCDGSPMGWIQYGNQGQRVPNFHVKAEAELKAIAAWNTRTPPEPATDAELVELAAKVLCRQRYGSELSWQTFTDEATAVIAALEAYERGPTPEQVREACARVCADRPIRIKGLLPGMADGAVSAANQIEAAIRALDLSKIGGE